MKTKTKLTLTVKNHLPTKIIVGEEIIDVYFIRPAGPKGAVISFHASPDVQIVGPHIIKKLLQKIENEPLR